MATVKGKQLNGPYEGASTTSAGSSGGPRNPMGGGYKHGSQPGGLPAAPSSGEPMCADPAGDGEFGANGKLKDLTAIKGEPAPRPSIGQGKNVGESEAKSALNEFAGIAKTDMISSVTKHSVNVDIPSEGNLNSANQRIAN